VRSHVSPDLRAVIDRVAPVQPSPDARVPDLFLQLVQVDDEFDGDLSPCRNAAEGVARPNDVGIRFIRSGLVYLRHHRGLEVTGDFFSRGLITTCEEREMNGPCEDPVVTERTRSRARAGEKDAFRLLIDPYWEELQLHW